MADSAETRGANDARPGPAVPAHTRHGIDRVLSPVDRLFETLVEASFDLIEELGSIDLAVYLHAPHDDQPLLFVRHPELAMLSPSQTFRLMHTVTMLSNGRKSTAAFRHGDLDGHYVRTIGPKSDGLYVFGGIQPADRARRITSITRAFARVLHQFHLDDDDPVEVPTVNLETAANHVRAEATIRIGHDEVIGTSSAAAPGEAVARAVMQALAPHYLFDELRTIDLGRRTAVLAVLRDERRQLRLGLAISSGDIIRTTALATRRAITQRVDAS